MPTFFIPRNTAEIRFCFSLQKQRKHAKICRIQGLQFCRIQRTVFCDGFYFTKNPSFLHILLLVFSPNPKGGLYSAFLVVLLVCSTAHAADNIASKEFCDLIQELQGAFKILRTGAFVGAGFMLAKYAWEAITTNKIASKEMTEGLKTVGIPMIVGFTLLFSIGIVLSFLANGENFGCPQLLSGW